MFARLILRFIVSPFASAVVAIFASKTENRVQRLQTFVLRSCGAGGRENVRTLGPEREQARAVDSNLLFDRAGRFLSADCRTRRRGRVAEGGGLLNRYTPQRRIEGSNPSVSATGLAASAANQFQNHSRLPAATVNHRGSPRASLDGGASGTSPGGRHPKSFAAKNKPPSCAGYFPISI